MVAMGPSRVGRYVVVRALASGGMGEVLLAEQTGLSGFSKRVALKRIRSDLAAHPDYVRMFLNEARTGSFLNHPNIVHVFDVGHEGDDLFLVMEYVEGIDLKRLVRRAHLRSRPLSSSEVAAIAVEVLTALDAAHHGAPGGGGPIVHRDLSPENIIVTRTGQVKVLDFGLAKWRPNQPAVSALEGNRIFGKVRYMPPEQLRGQLIDARADLYALSVVLYEVLTGELPYRRGTANEMLARILAGPPPPIGDRRPDAWPELEAAIAWGLAPDAEDRPPSAEAFRRRFVTLLQERGPALPLEGLRNLQHRPTGSVGMLGPDEQGATELSLPVAERCGKCGGSLRAFVVEDLILDRCASCQGTWVDRAELERLLGDDMVRLDARLEGSVDASGPLDRVLGACPIDRVGLISLPVPGESVSLELCPVCHGMWFDQGELQLLGRGDVATWLQEELGRVPST
jgi:Zn-finger nucleic acid-binding protein